GVPTFVWATRSSTASRAPASARPTPEQAAREHLARLAPFYGLDASDLRAAGLRYVHDTGRGGIIALFQQTVDGVEVFRDEMKILMDRNLELVAASGYLPSRSLGAKRVSRSFAVTAAKAVAAALQDFSGGTAGGAWVNRIGPAPGGYEKYQVAAGSIQPVRLKKVFFHLPEALESAYYLEL